MRQIGAFPTMATFTRWNTCSTVPSSGPRLRYTTGNDPQQGATPPFALLEGRAGRRPGHEGTSCCRSQASLGRERTTPTGARSPARQLVLAPERCGHVAFGVADLGFEYAGPNAFKGAGPRLLELNPMTIMRPAVVQRRLVPGAAKANTIGPGRSSARATAASLDGDLDGGVWWHRFIARLVAH